MLARADGYIKTRYADIGDRVKEGQFSPKSKRRNWIEQIRRAGQHDQANSDIDEPAALRQAGPTIAKITAERSVPKSFSAGDVISRQDKIRRRWDTQPSQANMAALGRG